MSRIFGKHGRHWENRSKRRRKLSSLQPLPFQGLSTDASAIKKWASFRVTIVRFRCNAVAASIPSTGGIVFPSKRAWARILPQRSATSESTGSIRPAKSSITSETSHRSSSRRFEEFGNRCIPYRSSPSVIALINASAVSTLASHEYKPRSGSGFLNSDNTHVSRRKPLKIRGPHAYHLPRARDRCRPREAPRIIQPAIVSASRAHRM